MLQRLAPERGPSGMPRVLRRVDRAKDMLKRAGENARPRRWSRRCGAPAVFDAAGSVA
jgi:hypothetical protein